MSAPSVIENRLIFSLDDPDHAFLRVALDCDDAVVGRRGFRRTVKGWALTLPRPQVQRLEYRLLVTDRLGETSVVCDPANPERVRTAFGERSVALMPGYERPGWAQTDPDPGVVTDLNYTDDMLGDLPITIWAPATLDDDVTAPLLVAHDGPEYADLADLTGYASAMIKAGTLPAFRVALMHPVERDEWYSANPDYLAAELGALDLVTATVSVAEAPVVMGASLGGLTALLVALAAQPRFAGVFAQSGAFFTPDLDPQESSYPFYDRVTEAVRSVMDSPPTEHPLLVGMTCGSSEENMANNREMAQALADQEHRVELAEVPDLHNYIAWRDSLDPTLTNVLRSAWGARG